MNAKGVYQTLNGKSVALVGARSLGEFLAKSSEAHDAFIERLFQHVTKQPLLAYGLQTPSSLRQSFVANKYSVVKLLAEMVRVSAMMKDKK